MRLLLDTHTLLWWFTNDPLLSYDARAAIQNESNEIYVSAASAWEIAIKHRLGKLALLPTVVEEFGELVAADGFVHLAITHVHSLRAGGYAHLHRDPFDRMLAAQSDIEMMTLVTRDPVFATLGRNTLW